MSPKSLLEDGDGLFGTHVTLEDVNLVVKEQLGSGLTEQTQFTVIGDGNGFSSRVLLVEPKWAEPNEHLPSKLVLKIISCQHLKSLIGKGKNEGAFAMSPEQADAIMAYYEGATFKLHKREMLFYGLAEQLKLTHQLLTPKIYFSKGFDEINKTKGFLGMEHFEGSVVKHVYQNVHPEELYPILKAIAVLQRIGLAEQENFDGAMFRETYKGMVEEHGVSVNFEKIKSIDRSRLTAKVERLQELGKDSVDIQRALNLNEHVGIKNPVMCHGDLWTANILWDAQNRSARIIDFQMSHFGNPAEDFVRLFTSTLSGEHRRAHWEQLLEKFYEFYKDGNEQVRYTLEQLKSSYRQFFAFGALAALPMFGPVAELKLKSMDSNSENEKYQEIVVKNLECLLDDIYSHSLENRQK